MLSKEQLLALVPIVQEAHAAFTKHEFAYLCSVSQGLGGQPWVEQQVQAALGALFAVLTEQLSAADGPDKPASEWVSVIQAAIADGAQALVAGRAAADAATSTTPQDGGSNSSSGSGVGSAGCSSEAESGLHGSGCQHESELMPEIQEFLKQLVQDAAAARAQNQGQDGGSSSSNSSGVVDGGGSSSSGVVDGGGGSSSSSSISPGLQAYLAQQLLHVVRDLTADRLCSDGKQPDWSWTALPSKSELMDGAASPKAAAAAAFYLLDFAPLVVPGFSHRLAEETAGFTDNNSHTTLPVHR